MSSLHRKITLAFVALAVLMAVLAAFAFLDLLFLEYRVEQGMTVTNLEATVQDMRREEKNLFLYHDATAGRDADKLAAQALHWLDDAPEALLAVGNPTQIRQLHTLLQDYRALLSKYRQQIPADSTLETRIRDQGHAASQIAESLFVNERQSLKQAIANAKWAQAIGVAVLAVLLLGVGRLLARSVVAPMKRLIEDLNPIAEGRFDRLELTSRNTEMTTLRSAFNRMLDELEARRRRLIQSEKLAALGVLVSGVAHELNNPLSNISSSCQLLLEELDTADHDTLRDWASTIDSETERARRIVDALLDFGRRQEPRFEAINLADLMERTLLLLRGQLRKGGVTVENHIPLDLGLQADPQRLQQVFINLLRNAAEGGENLTIHIHANSCSLSGSPFPPGATVVGELGCQLRNSQPMIEISISDNGSGIPPDKLPRVFEPFYTTRSPGHGMGLGLYIVQEIVQEHDGCIAIASELGQGTRVVIRLPCGGKHP
ncbi:MAG: HAMP domain-containing sensor histidine kinase [Thiothrix sp.]|uniref:sensor histidine kinase n=1 Tax=Thiothrix sp. TaxID=1032 RepID=UPI00262A27CE|nr:HAMP domain-containing sensor histidine kinase [Thiothrix sp.]MDD5392376.1 HAMP domain-containing sensor histidine kinase [Thiothrix sp.]